MLMLWNGTYSSSAAICARAVRTPVPSSTRPLYTVTLPSWPTASHESTWLAWNGPVRRALDRAHDAQLRSAAAQVAVQGLLDIGFTWRRVLGQQRGRDHDHAVDAK